MTFLRVMKPAAKVAGFSLDRGRRRRENFLRLGGGDDAWWRDGGSEEGCGEVIAVDQAGVDQLGAVSAGV
jgi:hypothetical protein